MATYRVRILILFIDFKTTLGSCKTVEVNAKISTLKRANIAQQDKVICLPVSIAVLPLCCINSSRNYGNEPNAGTAYGDSK
jgi:hypothetical protein